jgi:hypothetical protein
MGISKTERHMVENEMLFRRANEKIGIKLDELDTKYIEDGMPEEVRSNDLMLYFLCECSDENCRARIPMKLSKYRQIHLNRGKFIMKPDHLVKSIEKVISRKPKYTVVEKDHYVTEPNNVLNSTPVNNS